MSKNDKLESGNMNETNESSSYMGNIKSKDIGTLPNAGNLGGEMVRRMIKEQEEKLIEKYKFK